MQPKADNIKFKHGISLIQLNLPMTLINVKSGTAVVSMETGPSKILETPQAFKFSVALLTVMANKHSSTNIYCELPYPLLAAVRCPT